MPREVMTHLRVFLIALALVSLPSEAFCTDPPSVHMLTGADWKWEGPRYGNDDRTVCCPPFAKEEAFF